MARSMRIHIPTFLLLTASLWGCVNEPATGPQVAPSPTVQAAPRDSGTVAVLEPRVIDAPNGTFGYEILSDGRLFIRQVSVPGRPGVEGCHTREQAAAIAELVMQKIREGHMPPTVSEEELTALHIP